MSRGEETERTQAEETVGATAVGDGGRRLKSAPDEWYLSLDRGSTVGRYVVLARLGAGAMGLVLAAHDPELDRKVALKLLRPTGLRRNAERMRLQREAQALAKLNHPNVIAVHDVGLAQEHVFLAMEYIDGPTLGTWMRGREPRGDAGFTPRPWREVVKVFCEAGRGLAAAHAAGLVHRDFKPENVMLGDDGRVRVMDFGLARTEEESEREEPRTAGAYEETDAALNVAALATPLTVTGALMGTPAYMSPEQFAGEPWTDRSDQFGFCVALYEALYGERPFAGKTTPEISYSVSRGEVREAPQDSGVPSWLRALVLRGLSLKAEDRWPEMQALLVALEQDPDAQRRRRRTNLGLGLALLSIGGLAATLVAQFTASDPLCQELGQPIEARWNAAAKQRIADAFTQTKLPYAAETAARVGKVLDAYAAAWTTGRTEACEATRVRGTQSEALLDLRMLCYDRRLDALDAAIAVLAEGDAEVVDRSRDVSDHLPDLATCEDLEALRQAEGLPEDPDEAARVRELEAGLSRVDALEHAGRYDTAFTELGPLLGGAKELGFAPTEARAKAREGALLTHLARFEAAREASQEAYSLAIEHRVVDAAALASRELVAVGVELDQFEPARARLLDAAAWAEAEGSVDARARFHDLAGALWSSLGDDDRAWTEQELALEMRAAVYGEGHPEVGESQRNLCRSAFFLERHEEALSLCTQALENFRGSLGAAHPKVGNTLNALGFIALNHDDPEQARAYFQEALEVLTTRLGPAHPDLAGQYGGLSFAAMSDQKPQEALEHINKALEIQVAAFGEDSLAAGESYENRGAVHLMLREFSEARADFERTLAIYSEIYGADHPSGIGVHDLLARLDRLEGRVDPAIEHHRYAVDLAAAHLSEVPAGRAALHLSYGRTLLHAKRAKDALAEFEASHQFAQAASEPELPHVLVAVSEAGQAACWSALGQSRRAEALVASLRPQLEALQDDSLQRARLGLFFAEAIRRGQPDQARALARAALSDAEKVPEDYADEALLIQAWLDEHGGRR